MAGDQLSDLPMWDKFERAARARRRNPARLLAEYMQECLEAWEDQQLDEEMHRAALTSGYSEEDAVRLVDEYREEKRARGAAP
jgi:hypothetical protein